MQPPPGLFSFSEVEEQGDYILLRALPFGVASTGISLASVPRSTRAPNSFPFPVYINAAGRSYECFHFMVSILSALMHCPRPLLAIMFHLQICAVASVLEIAVV